MNTSRSLLSPVTGVTLVAVLGFALSSCGQSNARPGTEETEVAIPAIPVQIQEIQPRPFADALQVTGIVKAVEDVRLSPEEGGVIKEWRVEKGETVRKGDILAVLSDDVLKAAYEAAAAQYKLAETNFRMQKKVYAEKAISELQYRNAEYSRDAAKAQADLAFARLERTRLRSPINGILNDRFVDAGEYAPPAVPAAHIVNLNALKVAAEVSERYSGTMAPGSMATVTFDAFPLDTLTGIIIHVGAAISPSNRTMQVELAIANPGLRLKPEMIARVRIVRSVRDNVLLLSENVIQQVDRNKMVVYVENNGRAEERRVVLGARQGTLLEILEGLQPGDRVIVSGFQKLVNGSPVQVTG
ncbi:MAG: efflux RND transporter periplasmic adaptor subunit [Bacteroidota bacterium]